MIARWHWAAVVSLWSLTLASSAFATPPALASLAPPTDATSSDALPALEGDGADREPAAPQKLRRSNVLEGGLNVGAASELLSHGVLAVGPRLDVGVGLGQNFAFVIGETGRFAFDARKDIKLMAFDLQVGLAYGAPYQRRTGLGVVLLGGAERLSTSTTREGMTTWSTVGTLGLRASVAVSGVDLWIGVDGLVRSHIIETGGPEYLRTPHIAGILSIGCFFPAFARSRTRGA